MLHFHPQSSTRRLTRLVLVAALLMGTLETGFAQSAARPTPNGSPRSDAATAHASRDSSELPMTRAQGAAILEELRRIEILLGSRQPLDPSSGPAPNTPAQARIPIERTAHTLGRKDAPVVMVEFTDLECPACQRFHSTTFSRLKADYIDTGKVRFISRDLPLRVHPYAQEAAQAARCAGAQGKFWDFRDAVLSGGKAPTPEELARAARKVGLDMDALARCQQIGQFAGDIEKDAEDAEQAGINGTPAFVIGRAANGWLEGTQWVGNRPYSAWQSAIEAVMNTPATAESRTK